MSQHHADADADDNHTPHHDAIRFSAAIARSDSPQHWQHWQHWQQALGPRIARIQNRGTSSQMYASARRPDFTVLGREMKGSVAQYGRVMGNSDDDHDMQPRGTPLTIMQHACRNAGPVLYTYDTSSHNSI